MQSYRQSSDLNSSSEVSEEHKGSFRSKLPIKPKFYLWKRLDFGRLLLAAICSALSFQAFAEEEFEDVEIRVIRPRYMTKRQHWELGAEFIAITNQTFIYSFLGSGILSYHFTETLGLELTGAYGFSIDREDKRILDSEFDIQTTILRTQDFFEGSLMWTPIYGKYQLASGRLVYFDSYLSAGAGMTGIHYTFDHCISPSSLPPEQRNSVPEPPAPMTRHYPTFVGGIGQRFFLSRKNSFKWDIKSHMVLYDARDGSCDPENTESQSKSTFNVTLQIGASRFF